MLYSKEELDKLIKAHTDLTIEEQKEALDLKLKTLIRSLRIMNHNDNLDIINTGFDCNNLGYELYLAYCLEDEIATVFDTKN